MKERLKLEQVEPEAYKAMLGLEKYLHRSGLSRTLLDLIKIRASQINRCAFCIDMHTKDARKNGETQRIYALNAWNETPFFTNEERAALAMTYAVTLVAGNSISDDLYEEVSRYFTANQIAQILIAIVTINAWNRIAIATRMVPGTYPATE
jgi:AhpD family alkylhydroperoxidase